MCELTHPQAVTTSKQTGVNHLQNTVFRSGITFYECLIKKRGKKNMFNTTFYQWKKHQWPHDSQ